MKRTIFLWLMLVSFTTTFAQTDNITVNPGDFYRDEADLTARMHPVRNDNAQNCALLKIITTEKNFVFEPDALGMCRDVEYKTAEVWLWLAPGSRRLTIKHPQLGQLRNYEYPMAIEPSTVYVMKLTTGKVTTIVEKTNRENYLALTVTPPEAVVMIDGEIVVTENGEFKKMYPVGTHRYEAFCDLYYPQQGEFAITPDATTTLDLKLNPNYGFMSVTSQPESGASVYVNGRKVGTTPYKSDKLTSGSYTVQVVKDMWQTATREVTVTDEQTATVTLTMAPDFAEPVIVCDDAEAEIWLNSEKKGTGRWTGRLSAGAYKIEARRASHRSTSQSVTLHNGDKQTLTIEAPQPIYGKLNVATMPFGADILLNGQQIGVTPKLINEVLIGQYELTLQKRGYSTITKIINIAEGQTLEVNERLPEGKQIVLKSDPSGASLIFDGEYIGDTPQTIQVSLGNHRVEAQLGAVRDERSITVSENGLNEWTLNVPQEKPCPTKMKDYDGNEYNTVKIGSQCWMSENMRVTRNNKGKAIVAGNTYSYTKPYRYSPNNSAGNVAKYGYLYNWSAAKDVCPQGWHLPTKDEFEELRVYCSEHYSVEGVYEYIAKALASQSGWKSCSDLNTVGNNQSANNASGFSIMPAGGYYGGYCLSFGSTASLWSALSSSSGHAYRLYLHYGSKATELSEYI